jgi:hypothetical protein
VEGSLQVPRYGESSLYLRLGHLHCPLLSIQVRSRVYFQV